MICGISGHARVGKNIFGEYLAQELFEKTGQVYVLMAYAYELKCMVQREFDLSWDQLWGEKKEMEDKRYKNQLPVPKFRDEEGASFRCGTIREPFVVHWTGREMMQVFGQFYRSIDPDFWTKKLFSIIEGREYENVIITDVRHPNEVDPILERGGIHIRVERSIADKIHGSTHNSETSLDAPYKVDFTVSNNGTFEDLKKLASDIASGILQLEKFRN